MTEKAKILLRAFELVKEERAKDPEAWEREYLERHPEEAARQAELKAFLQDIDEHPEEYEGNLTIGEYNELLGLAADGDQEAAEQLKEIAAACDGIDIEADIAEYKSTIAQQIATNKEAIEILSEGRVADAETLLASATLADFEAVGATLDSSQVKALLSGNKQKVLEVVYSSLFFTDLLRLWQLLSERDSAQPGGGLNLAPYANKPPEKTAISNSLVANKLIEIEQASRTGADATVSPGKGGKKSSEAIKVISSLRYDDKNINITGSPLTAYDKTVHNAISSLYVAGNPYFTLQMVYRAMNGAQDISDIYPETLAPIKRSIEEGIARRLKIDATAQVNAYYKGKVKKVVYENYFLPLKKITVTMNNGEIVDGYAFLDVPPLYEYSRSLNQVISVDIGLLDTRKQLRNTPEVATIREYLIKRIEGMRNAKSALKSNNILYSTILAEAGIDTTKLDRTQLKRRRDSVKKILDHFKSKAFIRDYTEYKDGRAIAGITIEL